MTHFQIKYTFESHGLRKIIMSKSNVTRSSYLFPMVLYTHTKPTEYQITKKNYSSTGKYSLYKKK